MKNLYDSQSVHFALGILLEPRSITELRVLHTRNGTISGYFSDFHKLAEAVQQASGMAPGIYVVLNPIAPELLARADNRVVPYAKHTTSDADVLRRRWSLIDFDPVRPSGISSSDQEHEKAIERALQCRAWLSSRGWPDPIVVDSGNGAHLLYSLDLPNDTPTTELLKQCLSALDLHFSDGQVVVDQTTFNASRIWKVPGTLAAKGDSTLERPHRLANLLEVPKEIQVVSPFQLGELAALLPDESNTPGKGKKPSKSGKRDKNARHEFNIADWIEECGVPIVSEANWGKGAHKWILQSCPFYPEHNNNACAAILQLPNGAMAFRCQHDGCRDKNWHDFREYYEPGYAESKHHHSGDHEQERRSQATRLLELGANAEPFHSPDGEAYAAFQVNDHNETWPVRSKQFRQWLLRLYFSETESAPSSQAVQEAVAVFEARAQFDGPEQQVFLRIAECGDKFYLDLASEDWAVVEIDAEGWRIASEVPVRFRRTRGMKSLPKPISAGNVEELKRFINISSNSDWKLLIAWLLASLCPHGPYPVAVLHGEQGSAKSTAARVLRSLVDPNTADLRSEPRDVRDVMIAARNGWVVSLDNVSHLPVWLSDALCRLATGGGFATRELYTDVDETLIEVQRPSILNGIEELATRGDLLDRALVLYLPAIPDEKRRPEREFWAEFEAAQPGILGALLDVVSSALLRLPEVRLQSLPRMADFALWVTAAEAGLGWNDGSFLEAYTGNRASANELALEASPITTPLRSVALEGWEGTATELLEIINGEVDEQIRKQRGWPANARTLSNMLRRLAPNLRQNGIDIQFRREPSKARNRIISLATHGGLQEKAPACGVDNADIDLVSA